MLAVQTDAELWWQDADHRGSLRRHHIKYCIWSDGQLSVSGRPCWKVDNLRDPTNQEWQGLSICLQLRGSGYPIQLQSHTKEFDFLRCVEVEEKINDVDWLKPQGKSLYVLTTNSRSIKLWKMSHRTIKEVSKSAGKELAMPTLRVIEEGLIPK